MRARSGGRDGFLQDAQVDGAGIERNDLGGGFAAAAVEEDGAIAGLHPQDAAGVVRLGAGEGGGGPGVRREEEAMHEGKGSSCSRGR